MKKLWNNLPITKKLMAVTLVLFLVFCVVFFFGQMAFFESYYTNLKVNGLKRAADEIARGYTQQENYGEKIAALSDEHDCYIMLLGGDGSIKYAMSYYMEVETEPDNVVRISLDNAVKDSDFESLGLSVGDMIKVLYISGAEFNPSNTVFPLSIESNGESWSVMKHAHQEPRERDMHGRASADNLSGAITAEGKITSIILPRGQTRDINAERFAASRAVMSWMSGDGAENIKERGAFTYYFYTDKERGDRYCAVIRELENGDAVFTITPLNKVHEAADVAMHVYTLLFFFTMAGACIVGIIFARVVTRPILEITDITKSMANLDFDRRCEYFANDEIGELAGNINTLSDALDCTINELQEANEKLQADIEHERAVEKSRREFVAAASHELKTPLGVIRAYTEAIIDGVSESKRSRYMQVIVDETERMDRLILDMLDNAKLESGAQKPVFAEHDLALIMKNISQRFFGLLNQKNISFSLQIPVEAVIKQFDIDMIERVITNFIANAVSHTPENGNIICTVADTGEVSVENSGSHINDEDFEHIWDRFYKADKARSRSLGGTGLGLSIAKNILIIHKAEFGAQNTEHGVRFYFILQ